MNVIAAVKSYVDRIVSDGRLEGMKALLLDSTTTQIVSMVYSQSQVMEKEVYLVELLGAKRDRMPHLKAAVFIQPTLESVAALCREVSNPRFSEYHVFFSNVVHQDLLQQLASADGEHEVVRQVQEYYADFAALNEDFFTANVRRGPSQPSGSAPFTRNVNALLSMLLSVKRKPAQIRYAASSQQARKVAAEASSQIAADSIFDFRRQDGPLLLVLDRKDDPVTPLLSQWTYQAMVHELLGLTDNRCVLRGAPGVRKELEEVVLSCTQDDFFAKNRYANFGDLGAAVKGLMDEYQRLSKLNENIQTIEDMQAFLERFPAFKSQSLNVSKHVAVLSELARLVDERVLLDVSQLEQELACSDDQAGHQRALLEKIASPRIQPGDKLRLAMLYALRYEDNPNFNMRSLKLKLADGGVPPDKSALLDALIGFGGRAQRGLGLYGQGNLMSMIGKSITSSLQGVENVYSQHVPYVMTVIEAALKGKLKDKEYPSLTGAQLTGRPQEMIVYIVGGVTYEEAAKIAELNAASPNFSVVLGGSCVLNSSAFLEDLTQPLSSSMQPMEMGYR
ncbi:Sec1-like protein [Tribonema minus]|uniref:Sec1-like protein n=1 Tax=Tribonema minus TaxID=303371 RepID=A0A835YSG2_9STRA|nr:Sec1-like protein [Tribonema minus]